jgi:hypothetical protein
MQTLRMEVETCPCPVCRSDMAYIYPCESPVIFMTEMVISDFPISKKDHDAPKKPLRVTASGGHVRRVKKSTGVAGKPSPFKIDQGSHAPGN